jgi:hypothetical protein
MPSSIPFARGAHFVGACVLAMALSGCAVVTVAGAVVGVAATGAGLAVDAAAGAVRITGRAVGAAADAVLPGGEGK